MIKYAFTGTVHKPSKLRQMWLHSVNHVSIYLWFDFRIIAFCDTCFSLALYTYNNMQTCICRNLNGMECGS